MADPKWFNTSNDTAPANELLVGTGRAADGTDLVAGCARGFLITAAGDVKINTAAGTTVTLTLPATMLGQILWVKVRRLWATGTTVALASIFLVY